MKGRLKRIPRRKLSYGRNSMQPDGRHDSLNRTNISTERQISTFDHSAKTCIFPEWLLQKQDFRDILESRGKDDLETAVSKEIKTLSHSRTIAKYLSTIGFFSQIPIKKLQAACEKTRLAQFSRGEYVTKQHEYGNTLYILFEGIVEVYVDDKYISDLGEKELIGECAMTGQYNRTATTIAKTPIKCIELREDDYRVTVLTQKFNQGADLAKFISQIPLFEDWQDFRIGQLARAWIYRKFPKGHHIYNVGDDASSMYILQKGIVSLEVDINVYKRNQWPISPRAWEVCGTSTKYRKVVRVWKPKTIFGANDIMRNAKREYRATAQSDVVVYILNSKNFVQFFDLDDRSQLDKIFDRHIDSSRLGKSTEREIQEGRRSVKTLLDATQVNYSFASGKSFDNESKSLKWKLNFASGLVYNHRLRESRDIVSKRKYSRKFISPTSLKASVTTFDSIT